MRTVTLLLVLGLATLAFVAAPADAAPTGACGEGGGIWEQVDAVCAQDDEVCIVWVPNAPIRTC